MAGVLGSGICTQSVMRVEIRLSTKADSNPSKEVAMNCYTHQDTVAVAACSAGCGRALCGVCATRYDPPTCAACAAKLGRVAQGAVLDQAERPLESMQKVRIL